LNLNIRLGSDSVVSVMSALRQLCARERKSLRAYGMPVIMNSE
jgi:hypothetical protein